MMNERKKNFVRILLVSAGMTVLFLALAILAEPLVAIFSGPIRSGDSEWYIAAANGNLHTLIEPYSVRFLHPFIAGWFGRHLALDTNQAFLGIAIVSLFLFFAVNAVMVKHIIKFPLLVAPLFALPYFLDSLSIIFHPDIFYIFLTALFFLLVYWRKESASLLVFFLLFLTREFTILLGFVYLAASWFFSKKILTAAIIAIMLISLFTTGVMRDIGQPNKHDLNSTVYVAAKFSYNFMRNVLGLNAWTNTYQNCDPALRFSLPPLQSFGKIKEIGLCGFQVMAPIQTLITLLTVFGIAPLVLVYTVRHKVKQIWRTFPFWFLVAMIYGLASYFIGIIAGTGVARIVGYGWPAFLLATPMLVEKYFEIDRKFVTSLLCAHLFVAWLPFVVYRIGGGALSPAMIGIVLIVYAYCLKMMKKQKQKECVYTEAN